jgi:hypothetical protein
VRSQLSYYSGPIPPAEQVKELDAIVPGSAKQFVDLHVLKIQTEIDLDIKESEYSRVEMSKINDSRIKKSNKGLNFGFIIIMAILGSAVACSLTNHRLEAVFFILLAIPFSIYIIRDFILQGRKNYNENKDLENLPNIQAAANKTDKLK